jgi:hypothetical protein
MTTYAIYSHDGQELTTCLWGEREARRVAVALANYLGSTVYLDTVPTSTDPDNDEDTGEAIAPCRGAAH